LGGIGVRGRKRKRYERVKLDLTNYVLKEIDTDEFTDSAIARMLTEISLRYLSRSEEEAES
jgi:hypothetical protein